jgi:hypothetical protein
MPIWWWRPSTTRSAPSAEYVPGEYPPEVVEDLERMVAGGLDRWGLSPETAVSVLNLSENATFALSDPHNGRELVVRVHRVGYSSPEEIRSELAWIEALGREGVVETATPVAGVDGERLQTIRCTGSIGWERLPPACTDTHGTGACRPISGASDGTWRPWWAPAPSGVPGVQRSD